MKIALVSPYDITVPSGVNANIEHLAVEFRRRGHDVRTYAPGPPREEPDPFHVTLGRSLPVPSAGSLARVTFSPSILGAVRRLLAEEQFDIVHLHEPLVPSLPPVFLRFSKTVNVGTFHAAHDRGSPLYSLFRMPLRRWASRLHGRIAVSPAAAHLVDRYFPGDYHIIPNGVDVDRFRAEVPCPPEVLARRPYVLFVGRFEPRKGLPVLLRAFQQLKARRPDLHLVVVGEGSRRKKYERWVRDQALRDVHFTGYVSNGELAAYYQHAAVFCAPNTGNESFGIILLEAMAAGAPVVASNIEGFAAVVEHEVSGLLVPPRDPGALADALERTLTDADLAHSMAATGSLRVPEFSWPQVSERILAYYEQLLAEYHGRGEPAELPAP